MVKKKIARKNPIKRMHLRLQSYLKRRPHRMFRRTYRRDYVRSLKLPGYFAFTGKVFSTLRAHKYLFLRLLLVQVAVSLVVVQLASQEAYTGLSQLIEQTSGDLFEGRWGEAGQAGLLLVAAFSGVDGAQTEVQQVYAGLVFLFFWVCIVWLLRNVLAGNKVTVRDGIYNGGAPILSTLLVALTLIIQLLPAAIAAAAYAAAQGAGLLSGGVEAMLISVALFLLVLLSLYWVISTVVALVVVTLPGMYPYRAIQIAGDLVVGRRFRILLRALLAGVLTAIGWLVVLIPIVLLESWLRSMFEIFTFIPVVPFAVLVMSSLTTLFLAAYIYILYRGIVEDDAKPA